NSEPPLGVLQSGRTLGLPQRLGGLVQPHGEAGDLGRSGEGLAGGSYRSGRAARVHVEQVVPLQVQRLTDLVCLATSTATEHELPPLRHGDTEGRTGIGVRWAPNNLAVRPVKTLR